MDEILILSGAGLSAESGLKTFRDSGGLWEEYNVMEVCSIQGFEKDRQKVLDFYDERRAQLKNSNPNLAHKTIAKIKEKYKDKVSVLTQNVDDLLEKAGCKNVIHLHGELTKLRCEDCNCEFYIGYESQKSKICPQCNSKKVRHAIVMFGEMAPMYQILYEKLEKMKLFVCIGTSGEVLDVKSYARMAKFSILNNLEYSNLNMYFSKSYNESATKAILKIEKDIENFVKNDKI
ncbi:NAD-dependent protein deacetylase, SIR2 family [Campylobacter blaseri]|uniref:protein acetyllysine N-acetyltransferase n=1 Tax=Campylobacter blaseri TaxID=2042961 RepID=A0A2P8R3I2_9BACT|nr:Sir2 family NAD-dependent protein deacetylase [Campylobacter blaseri]PSM53056.1 NAD-dependent deacetylase [Campylobacter blaseri]PSM54523.1 NAD-dependent deacetylase [Campylobacter blaseri]QKF85229.1 NAD-dependent protein deacetylase, SIR2 family [Campylobacter blaseri]